MRGYRIRCDREARKLSGESWGSSDHCRLLIEVG